jgi:DHA1 family tetracycline resistance protein-like MFS transporter
MSPLWIVVAIVLVDLLGFAIVMPLLPRFASEYGFDATRIGLLMAAYPMLQLVAGPILGKLSDRYGRRPVLAISQVGTAVSFVILGLSTNYWVMLAARMLDGASGGNIIVAQAYIADVTKPEHRARSLGLIGAAFGVGFVLGPLMGGLLAGAPVPHHWQLRLPFLVAAGFSSLAAALVITSLPESLPADAQARQAARVVSWRGVVDLVRLPGVGALVAVSAVVTLAFAALEGTFSLFLKGRFGWNTSDAAYAFAALGLVSAMVQGGLIRRLVPRFGEARLLVVGIATLAAGLAALAVVGNVGALVAALFVVGVGQGITNPSVQGLISRRTPPSEQGAIFGVHSSALTLARMTNYLVANRLLPRGTSAPYWEGAALAAFALALAVAAVGAGSSRKPPIVAESVYE